MPVQIYNEYIRIKCLNLGMNAEKYKREKPTS